MALKVGVMASGRGSDFESVVEGVEKGKVNAEVVVLVTDKQDAGALEKAKRHKIESVFIDPAKHPEADDYFEAVDKEMVKRKVELVVLAGWMKFIRSGKFIRKWHGRMINIHPSLLPKFPGRQGQKDAFDAGEKFSGYTIHFVDESMDGGPIIYQESVPIHGCKSSEEVAAKILEREHVGLPMIVDSFARGKYEIKGRNVRYTLSK
ncbi:MAG: phosphoribosylglycinamide formyltransferase [Candidatus Micrarchaeia archaeon]|jgi:phosphoribosylglycinamide formyltransferase-1